MIIPNITIGGMRANLLLLDNGNLAVVVDTKADDDGSFAIDVYHQNWIIYRPLSLQTKNYMYKAVPIYTHASHCILILTHN